MQAGALNQRITIQQRTGASNAYGGPNGTWSDLTTVWASVIPVSGKESYRGQHYTSEVSHDIRIRYSDVANGITTAMRVKFGTRLFDIIAVIRTDEGRSEIQLLTMETNP